MCERTECFLFVFQDQFDNLEKHTSWGIDFLERYTKFIKERAEIELSYAKQIRYPLLYPPPTCHNIVLDVIIFADPTVCDYHQTALNLILTFVSVCIIEVIWT